MKKFIPFLVYLFLFQIADCVEIRKITPPQLSSAHILEKKIGYRPYRKGVPNFSLEKREGKILIHNYGHGGSGWTIGPGSAEYCIALLDNEVEDLDKSTPIAIIGGGCIGLYTGYQLIKLGFTQVTIYASSFQDLTSHIAGGLLAPVILDDDPHTHDLINNVGFSSYRFYKEIADMKNSDFSFGARYMSTYYLNTEVAELQPYVGIVLKEPKDVILDFGNGTTKQMVAYDDGIFIDTELMMQLLHDKLAEKIVFKQQTIHQFAELEEAIIFNCSGLGSKNLNQDNTVTSVQGHLIMLKDQNPEDLDYMILVDFADGKTPSQKTVKRCFHMFPKHSLGANKNNIGVLGGTMIEDTDSSELNLDEFEIILNNARNFYGIE